jgi:hypothetical protein
MQPSSRDNGSDTPTAYATSPAGGESASGKQDMGGQIVCTGENLTWQVAFRLLRLRPWGVLASKAQGNAGAASILEEDTSAL